MNKLFLYIWINNLQTILSTKHKLQKTKNIIILKELIKQAKLSHIMLYVLTITQHIIFLNTSFS